LSRHYATIVAESRTTHSRLPCFELGNWRQEHGVVAGITGAERGFDMALWGESPAGTVLKRWQRFQDAFRTDFRQFVVGHQMHKTSVQLCDATDRGLLVKEGLDGHATNTAGLLLTVLVADCVPVYLLDPASKALALLHAGWRGTAAGILEAGVKQLESLGVRKRTDIVMHCGVSICGDCYEVGAEVIEATWGRTPKRAEKLDLREVLAAQAAELGIRHVTKSKWCTAHDAGSFHSYRSNGKSAGRMAAYLGVPLA
jgi:polyphenol oxidase